MKHILIVEDEIIVGLELEKIVHSIGLGVTRVRRKKEALACLKTIPIDTVLLDINLSGNFEGIEIAKYLYIHYPDVSIIFITAYTDDAVLEAISAVNFVAYLVKPFRREEVKAVLKIEALKQTNQSLQFTPLYGEYVADKKKGIIYHKNAPLALTKKEQQLLKYLFESQGVVVPFEAIEEKLWPDKKINENVRRNLIYKLNKKLQFPLIKTQNSVGLYIPKNIDNTPLS